jgi:hypothetical protein
MSSTTRTKRSNGSSDGPSRKKAKLVKLDTVEKPVKLVNDDGRSYWEVGHRTFGPTIG